MIADCAPQLHIAAYHAAPGYNGDTPGIGALCDVRPDTRVAVGTYFNSIRRQSYYGALVWQPLAVGPIKVGVLAGAVTGYGHDVIPLAAFAVSLPAGRFELHGVFVPEAPAVSPATAQISVSYNFR